MRTLEWLHRVAPEQRWIADKSRLITDVRVVWQESIAVGQDFALVVAEFQFADGPSSLYFIPMETTSGQDVSAHPTFTRWMLDTLAGREPLPEHMAWTRLTDDEPSLLRAGPGILLGAEQSNTSIRYGDQALIKLNRRLTVGLSPEAELAAVIAKAADPTFAAPIYGTLMLENVAEEPICVAICSMFVPNQGDGWDYLLSLMTDPEDRSGVVAAEIEQIADVTAAMHIGLTSDPWRRAVSPELISSADIDQWNANSLAALEQLEQDLKERGPTLDARAQRLIGLLPAAAHVLRAQLHGGEALRGTFKIRVHGDYHLGQLLRRPSSGYIVVDFDGEPNRSLAERRDKYSALRDVAGMLRSFAYARGTAERSDPAQGRQAAWLEWERWARDLFLVRYQQHLIANSVPLIPANAEDMRQALTALELEKAIYECGYELGNRPDWLWLPLSRLVRAG